MWIKICGITRLEDAQLAIHAGADAIGFVFAESPRCMTPEAVREITKELPSSVEKIGLFVNAPAEEMIAACRIAGLSGVQLHGAAFADPASREALHTQLQHHFDNLRIIDVVYYGGDSTGFDLQLRALRALQGTGDDVPSVLVDTRVAGKHGGTGIQFDWQAAQDNFLQHRTHFQWIVAGGLHPENVKLAIQTLRPWGVDVSSGVESSPGKKDPKKVTEFIRAARQASDD